MQQQQQQHHHRGRAAAAAAGGHGGELGGGVRAGGRALRACRGAGGGVPARLGAPGLLRGAASPCLGAGKGLSGLPARRGLRLVRLGRSAGGRGAAPAAGNRLIRLSLLLLQPSLGRRRERAAAALPRRPGPVPCSRGGTMQTFLKGKRVGYWLSEKKIRKLNFQAFAELCR